jgi:DNA polymerase III alpha subunit
MTGKSINELDGMVVDSTVNFDQFPDIVDPIPAWNLQRFHNCSVPEFHAQQQDNWRMPQEYKTLDIAAHILSLCQNEAELQRCGAELLLFQERNLFNLLRYLKYLVDTMTQNQIIWGVGRGSSVASFVLYKLGVHRINSLYYELDATEFLR